MEAVVALKGPAKDMYKSRNEKTVGVKQEKQERQGIEASIDQARRMKEAWIDEARIDETRME